MRCAENFYLFKNRPNFGTADSEKVKIIHRAVKIFWRN